MTERPSGAQERKRAAKAMPAPEGEAWRVYFGCSSAIILLASLVVWAAMKGRRGCWVIVPAAILVPVAGVVLARWIQRLSLLSEARLVYGARGIRCLLVFSASPNWEDYIRQRWLPRLHPVAATLNWSERARWTRSLEVRLFNCFLRGSNFNPAVLVFRGLRRPLAFRYYEAFHQAKHGRGEYLATLEARMFKELGI